jgi:hypothetical protein
MFSSVHRKSEYGMFQRPVDRSRGALLKDTKSIEEGKVASGYHSPEIQILEGRQIQVWFRDGSGDERGRRVGRAVAAFRMSQVPLFERLDGVTQEINLLHGSVSAAFRLRPWRRPSPGADGGPLPGSIAGPFAFGGFSKRLVQDPIHEPLSDAIKPTSISRPGNAFRRRSAASP